MVRSRFCYHCQQYISNEHYEAHVRKAVRQLAGDEHDLDEWITERLDATATEEP